MLLPTLLLALSVNALPAPQEETSPPELPALQHSVDATVQAQGKTIEYRASLKDYDILGEDGATRAHFAAFEYLVEGAPATRPVTFAFNGGPGSSSIWLHMGLLGPRHVVVPSDAQNAGAPPYPVLPNPHTLLTHSDLVFVDPVGTGFSRAVGEATNKDFWGVDEDVASVSHFIREWLTRNERWGSPKYVLGESYGGVRGALVAEALKQGNSSVALNGLVFISPAFDIQFVDGMEDDLTYATSLLTYAVTAAYHGAVEAPASGPQRERWEAAVREFAGGPYLRALFAGSTLEASERESIVLGLSSYTGLSREYWRRSNLRVTASRFRKELLRERGLVLGRLDMRYAGEDIDGVGDEPDSDPMFSAIGSAYNAGFRDYLSSEFKLNLPGRDYNVSASGAFGAWNRSAAGREAFSGWLDTVPALAGSMRDNPELRVFCGNGWYDVATTVHAAEYNLSRPGIDPSRVVIKNYPAGHMMYVNQKSLEDLAADLRAFYEVK